MKKKAKKHLKQKQQQPPPPDEFRHDAGVENHYFQCAHARHANLRMRSMRFRENTVFSCIFYAGLGRSSYFQPKSN